MYHIYHCAFCFNVTQANAQNLIVVTHEKSLRIISTF